MINLPSPITGPWTLKDLFQGKLGQPHHGLKVLSTFSCGGGSSMGYKLAGFNVVGALDIDPEMMAIYRANLGSKGCLRLGIQDFNAIPSAFALFRDVDVLDGSPPCSVFSSVGKRSEGWGVEKQFREGQAHQRLDDLFMHFMNTVDLIKPKVFVAENVVGMLQGSSKGYVNEIFKKAEAIGYDLQLFRLQAIYMGVPQRRERIFFIGRKRSLKIPNFTMAFSERPITFAESVKGLPHQIGQALKIDSKLRKHWLKTVPGHNLSGAAGKGNSFSNYRISANKPAPTLATSSWLLHPHEPRRLTMAETVRIQTFPEDYIFPDTYQIRAGFQYVCGMSVPPLMMQRIALEIARTLLTV